MGQEKREQGAPERHDLSLFSERLHTGLQALAETLSRPGFGTGETTVGAELEVSLVDTHGRPAPINSEVRSESDDPRITYEIDRFNLELNTDPVRLSGHPFASLGAGLRGGLAEMKRAAALHDGGVLTVGILPTLRVSDLQSSAMTKTRRYEVLSQSLRQDRGRPFCARVDGLDPLELTCEDVTLEGANTSFQLHLKVPPDEFARTYNAAQLATLPALAVAGNSPFLVGHRLWEETRIALFKHSVDDRSEPSVGGFPPPRVSFGHGWVRKGACELFEESVMFHKPLLPFVGKSDPLEELARGETPRLEELRLHHGTVWRWNRAVYDAAGHIRIEFRAMPSGPSVVDMMANAAFLIGLTLGLAPEADRWVTRIPFEHARWGFYRAAQHGLDADLLWPASSAPSPRRVNAATLALELMPVARDGLLAAGVDANDVDPWLDILRSRIQSRQTGAQWQRRALEALERDQTRDEALHSLVLRYAEHSERDEPVHQWPI